MHFPSWRLPLGSCLTLLSLGVGAAQTPPLAQAVPLPPPSGSRVLPAALNAVFLRVKSAALQVRVCAALPSDAHCEQPESYGGGTQISPDGLVLTAYNIISDAPRLQLRRAGQTYDRVTVVGFDEVRDMALLKIETSVGPFVPLSPRPAVVGEQVFSMGYGQRLVPTVQALTGRVLALNVPATRGDYPSGTIQLDIPIYKGDGGGAVLNQAGEVLGVTSYIRTGRSTRNTAYANPVTADAPILTALKAGLRREAPVLGVTTSHQLTDMTLNQKYFQDRGLGSTVGCPFNQLVPGGPAALAGLHPLTTKKVGAAGVPDQLEGDVIIALGGQPVSRCLDLLALVRQHQVGDSVVISVTRDGQTPPQSVTVTLAPRSSVAAVPLAVTNQQLF